MSITHPRRELKQIYCKSAKPDDIFFTKYCHARLYHRKASALAEDDRDNSLEDPPENQYTDRSTYQNASSIDPMAIFPRKAILPEPGIRASEFRRKSKLKFLHTADIHLGAVPDQDRPWGKARAQAIWSAFRRIIDIAGREQVDLLLIAGDLFHRTPLTRECREANALFARIPDTRVVIIAGNHDCIRDTSPYVTSPWAENVTILAEESMTSVRFPELNVTVHGLSYHRPEIREPLYDNLTCPRDGGYHILLAHGGDETHIPIRMSRLAAAGFDYVALGHIHQPKLYSKAAMAYCGSPEPMDRTDIGDRGYILGDLDEKGCRYRWIPCSTAEYVPVSMEVNENTTNTQIFDTLQKQLDPSARFLYRVTLTGVRDPEIRFDPELIRQAGQIVDVRDETRPYYDLDALREEHAHDLIALYINELTESAEDPDLTSSALQFGLHALLHPEDAGTL